MFQPKGVSQDVSQDSPPTLPSDILPNHGGGVYLDEDVVSRVDGGGGSVCRLNGHILSGEDHLHVPLIPPTQVLSRPLTLLRKDRILGVEKHSSISV